MMSGVLITNIAYVTQLSSISKTLSLLDFACFEVCGKLSHTVVQCYYFHKGLSLSKKSSFKCCMAIQFFWHSI